MGRARYDQNNRFSLIATSSTDGSTPIELWADQTSHALLVGNVASLINVAYDYVGFSNADGNGNYQTIVYKSGGSGGTTVRTLTLTYDASSNVTSITRS